MSDVMVLSALRKFRIAAVAVGIGSLLLAAELVLHFGFDNESLKWWTQIHGFLFILYSMATANLGLKADWKLTRMAAVMLAGMVPAFSFYIERRVEDQVRADLSAVPTPAADTVAP
jgi:integral membrane protein